MQVAALLRVSLGWTLGRRRGVRAALGAVLAGAIAMVAWAELRPPPALPWGFQGDVIDPVTRVGIVGVEVDATPEHGAVVVTHTDDNGRYDLRLPAPETKTIHLVFRKDGYQGDEVTVPAGKPFQTDLLKVASR